MRTYRTYNSGCTELVFASLSLAPASQHSPTLPLSLPMRILYGIPASPASLAPHACLQGRGLLACLRYVHETSYVKTSVHRSVPRELNEALQRLRQVHRTPAHHFADSRQLGDLILPPHAGNGDRCEDEESDERQVRHAVRVPAGCSAVERGKGR